MLRGLIADFKQFPATTILGSLWVALFLVMVVNQVIAGPLPTFHQLVIGNVGGAHRYGDMTVGELLQGELWRALTCTFVHYSLLHIGMNLYGLYLFGCLAEMWYGPWQFVALSVVIGGGGNLVSGLAQHLTGSNPQVHSGGGSTLVVGLVALCAVVGWRSRTRIGQHLSREAGGILLFTALVGQATTVIDNWGHAGGALMGTLAGLAHRPLVRWASRPIAKVWGVAGALAIVGSGVAQVHENGVEDAFRSRLAAAWLQVQQAARIEATLTQLGSFYRQAAIRSGFEHARFVPATFLRPRTVSRPARGPASRSLFELSPAEFRSIQRQYLESLDRAEDNLGIGPTDHAYEPLRRRLEQVLDRPPSPAAVRDFQNRLSALVRRAHEKTLAAQKNYERLSKGTRSR